MCYAEKKTCHRFAQHKVTKSDCIIKKTQNEESFNQNNFNLVCKTFYEQTFAEIKKILNRAILKHKLNWLYVSTVA